MIVNYKDFTIEIIDDDGYSFKSADDISQYHFVYNKSGMYRGSQHGVRVSTNGVELSSAIISASGGSTTVHQHSFLIDEDKIFICCANHVFAINLPNLTIAWTQKVDTATCFAVYPFKGDLIVHGELEISRIDLTGNIKWQFGARDIFLTLNGESSFDIIDDRIHLKDFECNTYILDENGIEINL